MAGLSSSPASGELATPSRPAPSTSDVPRRADGVTLIGEMAGSGYREPPSLARRGDGQVVQLTRLLHLVLEAVDGSRSHQEIAERVSGPFGRVVSADNVRVLVDQQLRPLGLVAHPDGRQPQLQRSNPLLALRFKYAVTDPVRTRRLTAPFARLFNPVLVLAVLACFGAVCWWVFMRKGLASATYEAFDKPALLLLVVAVTVLSAGFHEFGHAAAARRGGATPGVMGAGVYLVWPAFYTDVTDSYRLGRGGRLRTDLGGLYFNAIVAVLITGVWWATGYDALLLVVATQILQMLHQLTPLVRFDGYHVLADLTGVPDLFHRIKPTLVGLLPWRWRHPESTVLKPWARAVVSTWVLLVVPILLFSLLTMVVTFPRVVGTAYASAARQSVLLERAWQATDLVEVAARVLAVVAVVFPVLAVAVILGRLGRRVAVGTWRRTRGRPVRRLVAALVAAAVVAGLAWAWWPRTGSYRPIQPWEGGTLAQVAGAVRPATSGLVEGQYGQLVTAWPNGEQRPTAAHPRLAMVLVPHRSGAGSGSSRAIGKGTSASSSGQSAWVFPFDKPIAPGPGDNQALAVNTNDGTVTYDVAFALVWVNDDSPALNRNESYAFASCRDCAAVSVAFQVVLVTGHNHVAAPVNVAAAVNYDCVNCLTYALATQLFLTLDGPLSDAGMARIDKLWRQIAAFGANIADVPLSEIRDRLTAFEKQVVDVIESEQGPLTDGTDQSSAEPSAGTSPSSGATGGSTTPGADSPSAQPSADGSSDDTSSGDASGASPSGGADSGSTAESPAPSPSADEPSQSSQSSQAAEPDPTSDPS
jgi:putative peptide zinc metalloprotease protein